MTGNIHSDFGMALTNALRGEIAGHSISLKRKSNLVSTTVGPFDASSPNVEQMMLTDLADIQEAERIFYFERSLTGSLGEPKRGDIVIDHIDGSEWKLLPFDSKSYWQPHGQDRSAYKVMTKQTKEG